MRVVQQSGMKVANYRLSVRANKNYCYKFFAIRR